MTERIPAGRDPEHWADEQIREAMARGDFDGAASHGRPLDLSDRGDPNWWLNRKLADEDAALVPPAIRLRREHDDLLDAVPVMRSRRAVRVAVEALNTKIRYANSHGLPGPPSTLMPVDVERQLARWEAAADQRPSRPPPPPETPVVVGRWWRRLLHRG